MAKTFLIRAIDYPEGNVVDEFEIHPTILSALDEGLVIGDPEITEFIDIHRPQLAGLLVAIQELMKAPGEGDPDSGSRFPGS